jgi:GDP-L-fucose synthase
MVKDVVGFKGALTFDSTKPDGTPRKLMETSKMKALGWEAKTPLREGLIEAYQDFVASNAG